MNKQAGWLWLLVLIVSGPVWATTAEDYQRQLYRQLLRSAHADDRQLAAHMLLRQNLQDPLLTRLASEVLWSGCAVQPQPRLTTLADLIAVLGNSGDGRYQRVLAACAQSQHAQSLQQQLLAAQQKLPDQVASRGLRAASLPSASFQAKPLWVQLQPGQSLATAARWLGFPKRVSAIDGGANTTVMAMRLDYPEGGWVQLRYQGQQWRLGQIQSPKPSAAQQRWQKQHFRIMLASPEPTEVQDAALALAGQTVDADLLSAVTRRLAQVYSLAQWQQASLALINILGTHQPTAPLLVVISTDAADPVIAQAASKASSAGSSH